jgi:hypothetical protein
VDVGEIVVEQNLDRVQVAYGLGGQVSGCGKCSQAVGGIVGRRASSGIKAATVELLSLDGFGMSVGRASTTTGTIKSARSLESCA